MEGLRFDENGLIPVVIQDHRTKDVLMVAYMNEEALRKTIQEKRTHFFSRSRSRLWMKGEESGNLQEVKGIFYDCDHDTILVKVAQKGVACHEGEWTCFHNTLYEEGIKEEDDGIIQELYQLVDHLRRNPRNGSYTSSLFRKGNDEIVKKVVEEVEEVRDEVVKGDKDGLVNELADLAYHIIVLMNLNGVLLEDVFRELRRRRG